MACNYNKPDLCAMHAQRANKLEMIKGRGEGGGAQVELSFQNKREKHWAHEGEKAHPGKFATEYRSTARFPAEAVVENRVETAYANATSAARNSHTNARNRVQSLCGKA